MQNYKREKKKRHSHATGNPSPTSALFVFTRCLLLFSKAPLSFCQQLGRLPFSQHHTKQAIAPSKRLKSWMRDSTRPQKRIHLSPQGFHTNPDMTGTRSCFMVASRWRLAETVRTTNTQIYKCPADLSESEALYDFTLNVQLIILLGKRCMNFIK